MFLRINRTFWSPDLMNKRDSEVGLYLCVFQSQAMGNRRVEKGDHVAKRLPNIPCFIWHP